MKKSVPVIAHREPTNMCALLAVEKSFRMLVVGLAFWFTHSFVDDVLSAKVSTCTHDFRKPFCRQNEKNRKDQRDVAVEKKNEQQKKNIKGKV